jgi:hypothetical protein
VEAVACSDLFELRVPIYRRASNSRIKKF